MQMQMWLQPMLGTYKTIPELILAWLNEWTPWVISVENGETLKKTYDLNRGYLMGFEMHLSLGEP